MLSDCKFENATLYTNFRKELDRYCIPLILQSEKVFPIVSAGKTVGLLCVMEMYDRIYIDCVYVEPEYRKQGLARAAVLQWYDSLPEDAKQLIELDIIQSNTPALRFWDSLFEMRIVSSNPVDRRYAIIRKKDS